MVKGVARSAAAAAAPPAPQALPTMQTGQNPLDPLTQLNSHRGFGAMAGVNPFSDMGVNHNDPNMVSPNALAFPYPLLTYTVAPNDDELAAVHAANDKSHVQPCRTRSNHCLKSSASKHGSPGPGGVPEREVQGACVRTAPYLISFANLNSVSMLTLTGPTPSAFSRCCKWHLRYRVRTTPSAHLEEEWEEWEASLHLVYQETLTRQTPPIQLRPMGVQVCSSFVGLPEATPLMV